MGDYLEYAALRFVSALAGVLSFTQAGRLGASLGATVFKLTSLRKSVTLDNIRHAFPTHTPEQVNAIAHGAYCNYGRSICEMLWSQGKSVEVLKPLVHVLNREVFEEEQAKGKGVILLSGHFGSWEMLVLGLRLHLGVPVVIIAQEQRNKLVDRFINAGRSRFGNTVLYMNESVRGTIQTLKSGNTVMLLGDQSAPKESVFVEFFGRPAATHRGAAVFSLKTGAPLVMMFLVRRADGKSDAHFERVDASNLGDTPEAQVIELTRRHTAILERYIRAYPDQWLWMHKRWKHTEHYRGTQSEMDSTVNPPA